MSAVQDGYGAALENAATEIMRLTETPGGPYTIALHNQGTGNLVPTVVRKSDSARIALAEETAVVSEDTVYDGNGALLAFTGQSLNNTPIVPGSVNVKPTAGGNTVNATDVNSDGILYTTDNDLDVCGSINYFTGALVLQYPVGKDPAAGDIDADYSYGELTRGKGKKTYRLSNVNLSGVDDTLIIKVAGSVSSEVGVQAFNSF